MSNHCSGLCLSTHEIGIYIGTKCVLQIPSALLTYCVHTLSTHTVYVISKAKACTILAYCVCYHAVSDYEYVAL